MKRSLITLLGCAAFMASASADIFEPRTFTSADGTKSFKGLLMGYNAKKKTVRVRKGMRNMDFRISLLSETDQEFIKENANLLAAANAIRLDFDVYKDKATREKTKTTRTITTPAGYELSIRNWTGQDINDIEIEYTIYHRKGAENGAGSMTSTEGSISISTLFKNSAEDHRTDPINLVRYTRKKSGGG